MIADELQQLKKQVQQLLDSFPRPETIQLEAIPSNYSDIRHMAVLKELAQAHEDLRALFNSPHSTKETLQTDFLKLCLERDHVNLDSCLHYPAMAFEGANKLYWEAGLLLFKPKNLAAMLAIVMPTVTQLLTVDIYLDDSVAHNRKKISDAMQLRLQKPELTLLAHYPAKFELISKCVIHDGIIFPLAQITGLPFHLQQQLFIKLDKFPGIKDKLYTHNDEFKKLSLDIKLIAQNGLTPKQMLSHFIRQLELAGTKYTGQTFAANSITLEVYRVQAYLERLPKALRKALKTLTSGSDTLKVILGRLAQKGGYCVEQTADAIRKILNHSAYQAILEQHPALSLKDIQKIQQAYGRKPLSATGYDATLVLPAKWREAVIKKIKITSANDYIDLIINLPPASYQTLLQFANITCKPPLPLELLSMKDMFTSEQVNFFVQAVVSCVEKMGKKYNVIKFADKMGDETAANQLFPLLTPRKKLLFALEKGNLAFVQAAIAAKADVNKRFSASRRTPLYYAVDGGFLDIVKCLVENGAFLKYSDLLHAVTSNHVNVVNYLLDQNLKINDDDGSNETALYIAASRGYLDMTKYLLESGADINKGCTLLGKTPLLKALLNGNAAVALLLLEHGANCHQGDLQNITPLKVAAQKHSFELVQRLIAGGADVNCTDRYGETPLRAAVVRGDETIVKLLLDSGAKVNHSNTQGEPALFFAAKANQHKVVSLLLTKSLKLTRKIIILTQDRYINQSIKSALRSYIRNKLTLKEYTDLLYQEFASTTLLSPKTIDFSDLAYMVAQQELREAHMQIFALLNNQRYQNRQAVKTRFKNLCLAREATNSDTHLSYSARPNGLCNRLYWHLAEYLFPIENLADMLDIVLPSVKEVLIVDVVLDKAVNHKCQRKTPVTESMRLSVRRAKLTVLSHYPADLEFLGQCLISDSVIFPLAQIATLPLNLHLQLFDQLTHYPDIKTKLYVRNIDFQDLYSDIRSVQTANATLHKLKKKHNYRIPVIDSTSQLPSKWCEGIINKFTLSSSPDYINFIRYLPPTEYQKFLAHANITCTPPLPVRLADHKHKFTQAQRSAFMQAVVSCIDKMGTKMEVLAFAQKMGEHNTFKQILLLLPPQQQLVFAIKSNDVTLTANLLASGAITAINQSHVKNKSFLIYAVKKGNLAICKLLFEHGADLTHIDDKHMMPLTWAIFKKNHTIIKWLIENGAAVDFPVKPTCNTALICSIRIGEITLIQLLLDLGANVDLGNKFGETPLIWATASGKLEIIKHLIAQGANINAIETKGRTALHIMARGKYVSPDLQIVEFLLSKHAKITSKLLQKQHKISPAIMALLKNHSKAFTLKQTIQLILEAAHDSQKRRFTTVHEQFEMIKQELATQDFTEEYEKCRMLLSDDMSDQALQTQFKALCLARDTRNHDTCLSFTAMPASVCNKLYWKLAKIICKPKSLMEMLAIIMPSVKSVLILDIALDAAVNDKSKKLAGIFANLRVSLRRKNLRVLAHYPADMAYLNKCIISDGVIFPIAQITKLRFHLHQQLLLALDEYPAIKARLYNYNDGFKQLISLITDKRVSRANTKPKARSPLSSTGSDLSLLPPVDQQIAIMDKISITSIDDYLNLIPRLPTSHYQSWLSRADITCVPPLPLDLGYLLMSTLPEQRQAFMQAVVSCIDKLGAKEDLINLAEALKDDVAVKQIVALCSPERQLFFAIREGDVAQMHALLSAGHIKNINHGGQFDGYNYLTYATCHATNLKVIELLIKHGANIHQADPDDCTAIALAANKENSQNLQYLLSHCDTTPAYFGKILLKSGQSSNVSLLKNYINQHLSFNETIQLLLAGANIQIQSDTKNAKISNQYSSLSQFKQHIALIEAHKELTALFNRVDLTKFDQKNLFVDICAARDQSVSSSNSPSMRLFWHIAEALFNSTRLDEMLTIVMPSIKEALIIDIQLIAPVNKQFIKLGKIKDHMRVVVRRENISCLKDYATDITLLRQFVISDGFIFPITQMTKLPLHLHKQLFLQLDPYPGIRTKLYDHNLTFKVLLENINLTMPTPKLLNTIPSLRSVRFEKETVLSVAERIKVIQHIKITSLANYHDILTNLAADQYHMLFEHAEVTCPAAALMQLYDLLCKIDKERCTAFLQTLVHNIDKIGDKHIVLSLVDKLNHLELVNKVLALLPIPEQLAYALSKNNIDLVMWVLEKDAGTEEFKNKDGLTPLMWAVRYHSLDLVLFLLAQGSEINLTNRNGTTPLLVAAISGRVAMVRYLLENGAQINHRDKCGNTALIGAAKAGHVDVVKLLLCNGADINLTDKRGRTPYDWAVKNHLQAVVDLLLIEKEFATLSQLGKVCHKIKSLGIFKQPKLSTGVNASLGVQMQVKSRVG